MAVDFNRPLLTMTQVKEWLGTKTELEGQIAALQKRLADVNQKLDAAAVLSKEVAALDIGRAKVTYQKFSRYIAVKDKDEEPMTDAVVRIVADSPNPMTTTAIRKSLCDEGYEKRRTSNYLYTVLLRLVDKEKLAREGNLYSTPIDKAPEPQSHGAPSDATAARGSFRWLAQPAPPPYSEGGGIHADKCRRHNTTLEVRPRRRGGLSLARRLQFLLLALILPRLLRSRLRRRLEQPPKRHNILF